MSRGLWASVLCVTSFWIGAAQAQVVERNLPPAPPSQAPSIRFQQPDLIDSRDETPLGANLKSIVLIGARDRVVGKRRLAGIDAGRIDPAQAAALRDRLAPYVGRPLTRRLTADIQATIVASYRGAGRPFVSVTVPPQEVTRGVLNVRVFEFRLGQVRVAGASPARERIILDRVQLVPGRPIDSSRLEADLYWLNRSPSLRVEAVFGPGRELAVTDLTLQVTETKPWQVFGGYTNTGTLLTDRDRFFVGGTAGLAEIAASYQLTGSKDFWSNNGRALDSNSARYVSHAGRIDIPVWARSSVELLGSNVQTNERPDAVTRLKTQTTEVAPMFRSGFSSPLIPGIAEWLIGTEFKTSRRITYLAGVDAGQVSGDVFNLVVGWANRWSDVYGVNGLDIRVKHNPGGVLAHNTSADWAAFTAGRVTDINTTLATLVYTRATPFSLGLTLAMEFAMLYGDRPLPDTERIAIGGAQTVRGYVTEDGAVDRAYILRNSLYLQAWTPATVQPLRVAPFVFGDVGQGMDIATRATTTLASIGTGVDAQFAPWLTGNLTAAYALNNGPATGAGDWRLHARIVASY